MSKSLLFMIVILTGLLVLACSKADTNRNANAVAPSNSTAPQPAGLVVTNKNTNASLATAEKIGVEECDTFLTEYDNCVSTKVPEQARAQYKNMLSQWRSSWKKAADNPTTRGTLAGICKNAMETSRAQYKQAIANWRTSWKKLAETAATRATLASVCKNQLETARAQLKAYNCTF